MALPGAGRPHHRERATTLTARSIAAAAVALAAGCSLSVPARAQAAADWPDSFATRVQALALIETLNADILASRSATAALERWCADHRLAPNPTVVAALVRGRDRPATADQRRRLQAGPDETIAYRHVRLACGDRVLSEADNWYVPSRLTAEMNRLLDATDAPFGRVVQSLEPYRQTFEARLLWSPLPPLWELGSTMLPSATGRPLVIPDALFEHRAVLYTGAHTPFSEVDEVYQRQLLAFPPRR